MREDSHQSSRKPLRYYAALAVACPVCGADPGARCIDRNNGEVMRGVHQLRDQRYNRAQFDGSLHA